MSAPRWSLAVLRRLAPRGAADDVLGDMEEAHRARVERRGRIIGHVLTAAETIDMAFALLRERHHLRVADSAGRDRAGARRPRLDPVVSWLDVKLGLRMLAKNPALSLIGGLGMAVSIAIGAGSVAFFDTYLYSTLPFEDGDRIVGIENWNVEVNNEDRRALRDFATWRSELTSVQDVGAFREVVRNLVGADSVALPVPVAEMTASGFELARVPALLGRTLVREDEEPGGPDVLVIGFDAWQKRFGEDRGIIGREVRIGNDLYTVVGVMPRGFGFPRRDSYWVPFRYRGRDWAPRTGPQIYVFGRLADGATLESAQAELTAIGRRSAVEYPETHALLRPQVLPYAYPILDIQDVSVWEVRLMQLIVSMLLVVVSANVAVLVYARTAMRREEIAVRTALGASRRRIVTQLFVESLVLCICAAIVGLAIARWGVRQGHAIMELEAPQPFWIDYSMTPGSILWVALLALSASLILGVIPALQATGRQMQATLRDPRGAGVRLGRAWTVLIVAQVAIAVAALPNAIAAGWHELRDATNRPLFDPADYLAVRAVSDEEPGPDDDPESFAAKLRDDQRAFQVELMRRLDGETGVQGMTAATGPPTGLLFDRIEIEGIPPSTTDEGGHLAYLNRVDARFFGAFDARIVAGRSFSPSEAADTSAVVVSSAFVETLLAGKNPIGRHIRSAGTGDERPGPWMHIIGVVSDIETNTIDPEMRHALFYMQLPKSSWPLWVFVRPRGTPAALESRIRTIGSAIDNDMRLAIMPLSRSYRQDQIGVRLVGTALALISASVLLLSAAGIYALMSFAVTRRRREIGIRSALGAHPRRLLGTIFARAVLQLALGLFIGLLAAFALDRRTSGDLLHGRAALALPAVIITIAVVGLFATLGPALRGLRIQPTEALRQD